MIERLMPFVAFAILCGFLLVLIIYVPRIDLGLVLLATVLLSAYDIFIHRPPTER